MAKASTNKSTTASGPSAAASISSGIRSDSLLRLNIVGHSLEELSKARRTMHGRLALRTRAVFALLESAGVCKAGPI